MEDAPYNGVMSYGVLLGEDVVALLSIKFV